MKKVIGKLFLITSIFALTACGMDISDSSSEPSSETQSSSEAQSESESIHTHTPETAWSSDETHHWHKCTGCDEKLSYATHTFKETVIPQIGDEAGYTIHTCSACGYLYKDNYVYPPEIDDTPFDSRFSYYMRRDDAAFDIEYSTRNQPATSETIIIPSKARSIPVKGFTLYGYTLIGQPTTYEVSEGIESVNVYDPRCISDLILPESLTKLYMSSYESNTDIFNVYNDCYYLGTKTNPYFCFIGTVPVPAGARNSIELHKDCKVLNGYYQFSNVNEFTINENVELNNFNSPLPTDLLNANLYNGGLYIGNETNPYIALIGVDSEYTGPSLNIHINCKGIASCALRYNTNIKNINMPLGLKYIGSSAFNHSNIVSITIPNTVNKINERTFSNCASLKSVVLPDGLTELGYDSFYGCTSLESLRIPNSIEAIGSYSLPVTANMYTNYEGGLYIGNETNNFLIFVGTSKSNTSTSLSINNNTKIIYGSWPETDSLIDNSNIKNVSIPNSVEKIINQGLSWFTSLESLEIPSSVKVLAPSSIGSENLKELTFSEGTLFNLYDRSLPTNATINFKGSINSLLDAFCSPHYQGYYFSKYKLKLDGQPVDTIDFVNRETIDLNISSCFDIDSIKIGKEAKLIKGYASDITNLYYEGTPNDWIKVIIDGESANPGSRASNIYFENVKTTDITLSNTIESINDYAFFDWNCLDSITVPNIDNVDVGIDALFGDYFVNGINPVNNTIFIWATAAEEQVINTVLEQYNSAVDDANKISVRFVAVAEGDTGAEVAKNPTSSRTADLFLVADDYIYSLQSKGIVADLTSTYGSSITANNTEIAVECATYDGKIYGFPVTNDNGYFLWYNKQYLGTDDVDTLEDLLSTAHDLNKKILYDIANGWYAPSFFFSPDVCGTDSLRFSENSDGDVVYSISWDNDKAVKAFDAVNGLISTSKTKPGTYSNVITTGGNDRIVEGFRDNSIIAAVCGTWMYEDLVSAIGEENLGACKLPTFNVDGDDCQMATFTGSKLYCINAAKSMSEQKRTKVYTLAELLSSEYGQLTRFSVRQTIPSNINAQNNEDVINGLNIGELALMEQVNLAAAIQSQSAEGRYWDIGKTIGQAMLDGKLGDYNSTKAFLKAECNILRNPY